MATMRGSTAGRLLLRRAGARRARPIVPAACGRRALGALLLLLSVGGTLLLPGRARAQATAADSAAILLQAADGLAREGRADAAAVLLAYLRAHFPLTPAADEAARRLAALPAAPATGGRARGTGRTELTVWGTTYGGWAGIALPFALGADGPETVGLGLLLGAPAGFLAARSYARATDLTEGEARAITFGGTWGTWQGFGWAKVAGALERTICPPPPPCPGCTAAPCYKNTSGKATLTWLLAGGAAGIAAGAALGNNMDVSPGAATTVNLAAIWGTGYGLGAAALFDAADNGALTLALVGGDAALVGAALATPQWRLSRERARLISIAGLAGVLAGAGVDLIAQNDSRSAAALPMAGGAIGLLLGAHATRSMPAETAAGANGGAQPGSALLQLEGGRLGLGSPAPAPVLRPDRRGGLTTALYLPVFHARF